MEEFIKIEELIDHTREYVNTRVDEAKLALAERSSAVIALVIARSVVSLVFLISLLLASAGASYALGIWLGKTWLGFLIMAAVYFLAGIIVWAARERLIRIPVMNGIIHQLFKNDNNDETD